MTATESYSHVKNRLWRFTGKPMSFHALDGNVSHVRRSASGRAKWRHPSTYRRSGNSAHSLIAPRAYDYPAGLSIGAHAPAPWSERGSNPANREIVGFARRVLRSASRADRRAGFDVLDHVGTSVFISNSRTPEPALRRGIPSVACCRRAGGREIAPGKKRQTDRLFGRSVGENSRSSIAPDARWQGNGRCGCVVVLS